MREIAYNEKAATILEILPKGAFLTTKADEKVNVMTIGWGYIGYAWGKPVFTVMVRKSRFTYELIEKANEFTLTFPTENAKAALGLCATKSGRDIDKIDAAGLKTLSPLKISTPILDLKGIHMECKVLYKNAMLPENLDAAIDTACYPEGDYHTLYFSEILACYVNE